MFFDNPKRTKILLLVAENENQTLLTGSNTLIKIIEKLIDFRTERRFEYQILNLYNSADFSTLYGELDKGRVVLAAALAGMGSSFKKGEENLWTASRVPFLSFWHDHPSYAVERHAAKSPFVMNCYHVRDHFDVWVSLFSGLNHGVFLAPYFGLYRNMMNVEWCERDNKIFYAKTGRDPKAIEQTWADLPRIIQDLLRFHVEQAKKNRSIDLVKEVQKSFKDQNLPFDNWELSLGLVQEVDAYIRAWRSDVFARALLKHDAIIAGNGWDYLKGKNIRATFAPTFSFSELMYRFATCRLLANSSPLWREGIHERLAKGLQLGSVTLTDRTEAGDRVFGGLPSYVGFDWGDDLGDVISLSFEKVKEISPEECSQSALASIRNHGLCYIHNIARRIDAGLEVMESQVPVEFR